MIINIEATKYFISSSYEGSLLFFILFSFCFLERILVCYVDRCAYYDCQYTNCSYFVFGISKTIVFKEGYVFIIDEIVSFTSLYTVIQKLLLCTANPTAFCRLVKTSIILSPTSLASFDLSDLTYVLGASKYIVLNCGFRSISSAQNH